MNVLNATDLLILKWLILCSVKLISIKKENWFTKCHMVFWGGSWNRRRLLVEKLVKYNSLANFIDSFFSCFGKCTTVMLRC